MYKGISQAKSLQQKDTNSSNLDRINSNPADEFNINSAYLMLLVRAIENWTHILYYGIDGHKETPDYFDQLISVCDIFIDLVSARIRPEEVDNFETQLDEHKEKLKDCFYDNAEGQKMYLPDKGKLLLSNLRKTFRRLMAKMQVTGMLTKLNLSPSEAITEME